MWFFIAIISVYSLLLFYFTFLWSRNKSEKFQESLLKVTVIVPFRDEEDNLSSLINSFNQIDYPADMAEFIFVNDHSTDQSEYKLQQYLINFPFPFQILSLPMHLVGKKQGIIYAVGKAKSPVIIATDADCEVPSSWLHLMQVPFHSKSIHLVSGNVVFKNRRFLDKLFQMEFAPLIGIGGVSILLGKAGMANGANIAFRKSTFEELEVFKDNIHIPTGDDIFLLQKISNQYPKGIAFQKESIVFTNPPKNLSVFFHQRVRWASKWKAAANRKDKLPALSVWVFHLIYLIGTIGFLLEEKYFLVFVLFFFKMTAEFLFLNHILKSQKQKFNILAFLILQVLYSIYVTLFGLLANFSAYKWKGRIYGKHDR